MVLLVALSNTCSDTHWTCIDWFKYLGDSFVQNYSWILCLAISIWIMSYHSSFKCFVSSRSCGPNLKQSGNGIPSLIRNLISGSIFEQSVGNYSKRFKTHFINGPVYPFSQEIFIISEQMWRNPFWNRCGFSRFWCWSFSGWLHEFLIFGMDLIHLCEDPATNN